LPDQARIWSHFQNEGLASFDGARPRHDFLSRKLARLAPGTPRLLNIGAGSGYLEKLMLARGWNVSTLDPDERAIARLTASGVDARCGVIEQMPFEEGRFDIVAASEVLEHMDDRQREIGLGECHRVLRGGGIFTGTVPWRENLAAEEVVCPQCTLKFHRWGHQKSFTIQALHSELAAVFDEVKASRTAYTPHQPGLLRKLMALARVLAAAAGQAPPNLCIYFTARKLSKPEKSSVR
ncbi:MAG: class I SAM-dependent methyltransferase, partial [Bryobacteraceae bacterium]